MVETLQQTILPKRHWRSEKVFVRKLDASGYSGRERDFLQHTVAFIKCFTRDLKMLLLSEKVFKPFQEKINGKLQ